MGDVVTRRCLKPECPATFITDEESDKRYCSDEHAPLEEKEALQTSFDRTDRPKRLAPEVKARMLELCREGLERGRDRSEILHSINTEGITSPKGLPITLKYLALFMLHNGLAKKKDRPGRGASRDEALAECAPPQAPSAGGLRINGLVFAILTDGEMEDGEKIGMLRRYAGID